MTTMTMANQALVGNRRCLEELVERWMDALLGQTPKDALRAASTTRDDFGGPATSTGRWRCWGREHAHRSGMEGT